MHSQTVFGKEEFCSSQITGTVHMINQTSSRKSEIMILVRDLVLTAMQYNIHFNLAYTWQKECSSRSPVLFAGLLLQTVSILGPASPDELTPGHPARNVCLAWRGYYESPWPHRPGTPIKTALHSCYQFLITNGLLSILSLQSASVALYLSELRHEKGFFRNTLCTHTSALTCVHELLGWLKPANSFLLKKVLQGAEKRKPGCDSRLPITLPVLFCLVDSSVHICRVEWDCPLYRAVYLSFFAFLRVGKMTANPGSTYNALTVDHRHW